MSFYPGDKPGRSFTPLGYIEHIDGEGHRTGLHTQVPTGNGIIVLKADQVPEFSPRSSVSLSLFEC